MRTRQPLTSGIFFPQEAEACRAEIETALAAADQPAAPPTALPFALMLPHAAWEFIQPLLAQGLGPLHRAGHLARIKTILLLGPCHGEADKALFLPKSTAFASPLGEIAVVQPFSPALIEAPDAPLRIDPLPHEEEAVFDALLPWISYTMPQAAIIPLLAGAPPRGSVKKAVPLLSRWLKDQEPGTTLLLATGNLSSLVPADHEIPPENLPLPDSCAAAVIPWIEALRNRLPGESCPAQRHALLWSPPDPYQKKKTAYGIITWDHPRPYRAKGENP